MQCDNIEKVLYDNSLKMLNKRETIEHLMAWKKEIIIRIILVFPGLCMVIFFTYTLIWNSKQRDIVATCLGIFPAIILWKVIVQGIFVFRNEIKKYYEAKGQSWMRSIAYIMKNERGKLQIKYAKGESMKTREIEKAFGADKMRLEEKIYITFITVTQIETVIILKDTGWAVFPKREYGHS